MRFSCGRSVRVGLILNLDVDVGAVADKWSSDGVVDILVQDVHIAELTEDEVAGAGEVEGLRGELVLLRICNSHGDVVVTAAATDTAPEQQFLKFSVLRVIKQLLEAHVQAKSRHKLFTMSDEFNFYSPFLNIQTLAIVFEDAKVLIKFKEVHFFLSEI